jgi:hypothetical protein
MKLHVTEGKHLSMMSHSQLLDQVQSGKYETLHHQNLIIYTVMLASMEVLQNAHKILVRSLSSMGNFWKKERIKIKLTPQNRFCEWALNELALGVFLLWC